MLQNIRVLLFDVFGTLIFYPSVSMGEQLSDTASLIGLKISPERYEFAFELVTGQITARRESDPEFAAFVQAQGESFYCCWHREMLSEIGVAGDLDDLAYKMYEHYILNKYFKVDASTLDVLQRLHGKIPMGIISNSPPITRTLLEREGILRFVEHAIISGEVKVEKPERAIFEIALNLFGVAAEEAAYVGDEPGIDVVGAHNADLRSILLTQETSRPSQTWDVDIEVPHTKIGSLEELPGLLGF